MKSDKKYLSTPAIGLSTGLIGVLFLPIGLKSLDYVPLVCSIGLIWGSALLMLESIGERIRDDVVDELTEEEPHQKET